MGVFLAARRMVSASPGIWHAVPNGQGYSPVHSAARAESGWIYLSTGSAWVNSSSPQTTDVSLVLIRDGFRWCQPRL